MNPDRLAEMKAATERDRDGGKEGRSSCAATDVDFLLALVDSLTAERNEYLAEIAALRRGELTETLAAVESERNAAEAERDRLAAENQQLREQITKQAHIRRMLDEGKCATEISNELTRMEDK